MTKDQRIFLRDILERIERIEETAAEGRDIFRQSHMHQDSIIRNFEVIGEIVKRLSVDVTSQYPDVLWADFAGFRDVLIHQYDKVILDIVWESVKTDLPSLRAAVESLLASLPPYSDNA